jgi:hypothetical protein
VAVLLLIFLFLRLQQFTRDKDGLYLFKIASKIRKFLRNSEPILSKEIQFRDRRISELLISGSNGSQLIEHSKYPNRSLTQSSNEVETINIWELLAGLEEEIEDKKDNHEVKRAEQNTEEIINNNSKRAVSCEVRSF